MENAIIGTIIGGVLVGAIAMAHMYLSNAMSFFGKVRNRVPPRLPAAAADQQLRTLLSASVEVLGAFGACLERESIAPRPLGSIKSSEAERPFPKKTIKGAIAILQQAIQSPRSRTILVEVLSPAQA